MVSAKKAASSPRVDEWLVESQRFQQQSREAQLIADIEQALKALTGNTCGFVLHVHNLKPGEPVLTFSNLEGDDAASLSRRGAAPMLVRNSY